MIRRAVAAVVVALALAPAVALAAEPTPAPTPAALTGAEKALVAKARADLQKLYGTTAAATRAGYYRYNNEDKSGAISWVNGKFTSPDVDHPSQLWYDANGRLLGADYSVRQAENPHPASVLGIAASRCDTIPQHVHYGLKQPDGTIRYGLGAGAKAFREAGGDPDHPDAATLVKMGKATSADAVAFIFNYDAITNCSVWVLPNANGPFADLNPAVTPSANRTKNSTEGH